MFLFEPEHVKTNKMTCAPGEDSDQKPILICVFVGHTVILLVLSCGGSKFYDNFILSQGIMHDIF